MATDSRKSERLLRSVTNGRQARRIVDLGDRSALVLVYDDNRTMYVTNTDDGLYAVAYGAGGGLYLARIVEPGVVSMNASRDDVHVDVTRDPPGAINRGKAKHCGGDD